MKIFLDEKDIIDNNHEYARLNNYFDDGEGSNDKNDPNQHVYDNCVMGKAYLANAVLTLQVIIQSKDLANTSDLLSFPVLFNVWHGLELLLKSGLGAITILTNEDHDALKEHNIFTFKDNFEKVLTKKLNMNRTALFALKYVNDLLEEFKKVNAHFDFARYSFNRSNECQFYNAPFTNKKQWQSGNSENILTGKQNVPCTYLDLIELLVILKKISKTFLELICYINSCIKAKKQLSDEDFDSFKNSIIFDDENDYYDESEKNVLKEIVNSVYKNILRVRFNKSPVPIQSEK